MTGYDKARKIFNTKANDAGVFRKFKLTGWCVANYNFPKRERCCNLHSQKGCNECIKKTLEASYKDIEGD